jgi:putative secretion ATPase (PEP-CTERM system associated)
MYESYFNLTAAPFQLTPDHRYFYASAVHKRAMGYLTFGLNQGEGFVVITGEVGAGKTTLVAQLLSILDPSKFVTANVVTTHLGADDMLRMVAANFEIPHEGVSKSSILFGIHNYLKDICARGMRAVLIVDEAQNLSLPAIEELRMLSNLVVGQAPSLQMLLLGQPQFRKKMASPDLAQLRQRVIATYHLGPISAEETRDYIRHRLTQAGWKNDPSITNEAFNTVYAATGGVPRIINLLFTRVLLFAYLEEIHHIDAKVVQQVAMDLKSEFAGPAPSTPTLRAAANSGLQASGKI